MFTRKPQQFSRIIKCTYCTKWQSVVGLEVHAQINTKSKLFSSASNHFNRPVNGSVALFDCGIPGTLPVVNVKCVEAGVLTALALGCHVNAVSMFDRKHYFYADLPLGYQITQQRHPLAVNGLLEFQVYSLGVHRKPYMKRTQIKQLQLEQDSGRSIHDVDRSYVNLNRAGIPLMEVVFEPDLSDGEEAAALIKELIGILQRLGTCSCKMEEGVLRVDANVSMNRKGEELGVRTEIKNIGSIRGVAGAIAYEIARQRRLLERGERIVNETRAWDANSKITVPMRDKEEKQDYRYMPEPNLPPLHLAIGPNQFGCVRVDALKDALPELPNQTRINLIATHGLTLEQAIILVNEDQLLVVFNDVLKRYNVSPKLVANLLINDLLAAIYKNDKTLEETNINCNSFSEVAHLLHEEVINRSTASLLLHEMLQGNINSPMMIVEERQWKQINDGAQLTKLCAEVIEENPKIVEKFKGGKVKVFNALMGKVANKCNQCANMAKVAPILKELLNKAKI